MGLSVRGNQDLGPPVDAVPGAGGSGPGQAGHRHLHWRWWTLPAVLVVLVLAAGLFVFGRYELRSHPGAKPMGDALNAFRSASTAPGGKGAGLRAPAVGVYRLEGQGGEKISFPPNSQKDGAVMPASVVSLADGCWRWHVDYNVAHWEEYDFCPQGLQLMMAANRNSQAWDFGVVVVKNLAQYRCDPHSVVLPVDAAAGQVFRQSCSGSNSATPGVSNLATDVRVVGIETLPIGGVATSTVHEVLQITVSGAQKGTGTEDWWYVADTGLPVRMERQIKVGSPSPVGTVTYTEAGSWQMTSLQPQT